MTIRSLSPKKTQNMSSKYLCSFVLISAIEAASFHHQSVTAFAKGFQNISSSYFDSVISETPCVHRATCEAGSQQSLQHLSSDDEPGAAEILVCDLGKGRHLCTGAMGQAC